MEYIFLSGEVGFEITPYLLQEKFKNLPENEKDVTIYVNTVGGYAYDGIAIYDYLKLKQSEGYNITTVGSGVSASAGTIIFLAGNKESRKIHNTTTFLIHEGWNFAGGTADDFEKAGRELKELNNKVAEIYAAETNLSKEEALEIMAKDESLNADFLLEKGFVAEIIKYQSVATLRKTNLEKLNTKTMAEVKLSKDDKSWLETMFNKLGKVFKPVNKIIQDANGTEIDFYELEADQEPKVDDKAKVDGKEANGEYVITKDDGTSVTYVFENGILTEIKDNATDDTEALKQENAELKAQKEALETKLAEMQESQNKASLEFENFKKEIQTKFQYDKKDGFKDGNGNEPKKRVIKSRFRK